MPTSLLLEYCRDAIMPNKCSEIGFWSPVKCPVFFQMSCKMSCIFFRTAGIADTLLLTGCQNIDTLLLHWHFLWLPMHGPYSQLYSVGGSSDAAVRCRYYSNLLMMNLMFAGEMPYVVELFCRRSTMSRCILLTLQFATTPKRRMIHTLPRLKNSVPKRSGNLHAI